MLKKKFKKTVSIFLSLCMILTMFAGAGFAASADTGDQVLYGANLTESFETPKVGGSADSFTIDEDGYTANLYWMVLENYGTSDGFELTSDGLVENGTSEAFVKAEGTFESGKIYALAGYLEAKDGYVFYNEESSIYVSYGDTFMSVNVAEDGKKTEETIMDYYSLAEPIETIHMTDVNEAKIGAAVENQTLEGDYYTANTVWYVQVDGEWERLSDGDVFEDGKRYSCIYEVFPKAGYSFERYGSLCINNENDSRADRYTSNAPHVKYFEMQYSFLPKIYKVEFSNLPTAVLGEEIKNDLTYPEDAAYTVDSYWNSESGGECITGVFEKDQYDYFIDISSTEYEFSEDLVFVIDGVEYPARHVWGDSAYIGFSYDFRETYDTLEFSGIPAIKAGDHTSDFEITVPEGACYEADALTWYDCATNEEFVGTFESGKIYRMDVIIRSLPGYIWASETRTYTDADTGEVWTEEWPAVELIYNEDHNAVDIVDWFGSYYFMEIYYAVDATEINALEISLPDNIIGQDLSSLELAISGTDGCKIVDVSCFSNGSSDGVFTIDNRYYLSIQLKANDGYYFNTDQNLVATFGDEKYIEPDAVMADSALEAQLWIQFDITKDGEIIPVGEMITAEISEEEISAAIADSSVDVVTPTLERSGIAVDCTAISLDMTTAIADAGKALALNFKDLSLVVDNETLTTISSQFGDLEEEDYEHEIYIDASEITTRDLSDLQIASLEKRNPEMIVSIRIRDNYIYEDITSFGGGTVTLKIPFTPSEGNDGSDYTLVCAKEDGTLETIKTVYEDGYVIATLTHLSDYAIVKKTADDVVDDEDDSAESELSRLYGDSRYATSFAIADALKTELGIDKFETVIVTNGENYPDALSGSYLAAKKDAPILMVNTKNATNIANLHAYIKENVTAGGQIYILGGTDAVSKAVETGLEDYDIDRLFGNSRYATNLAILEEAGVDNEDILICTGAGFADSLSASATGKPILLVDSKNGLNTEQKTFLDIVKDNDLYIIGGSSAVSTAIENELIDNYGGATRIFGDSRYKTSVAVAEAFCTSPSDVVVAYGENFPDGLCGGPLAYTLKASLILTAENKEAPAVEYLTSNGITSGKVLGGTGVLSDNVVDTLFVSDNNTNSEDTVYKLVVTQHDPEASAAGIFLNNWAAEVEEKSDGRIDIEIYHGGALAGPMDALDAVLGGTIDIAWGLSSYFNAFPLTKVFTLPCLDINSAVEGSEALWNLYSTTDYLDAEYENYHVLYLHTDCQSPIATVDQKIDTVSDLKGMAICVSSGQPVNFVDELGAAAEACAINNLYANLDKGVYDAFIRDWETIAMFNLYETISYFLDENVGVSTYFMLMNPDSYAELPEDLQAILDEVSADAGKYTVSWDEAQDAAKAQEGVAEKLYTLSETERANLEAVAQNVIADWIENTENGQEIYDAAMKCIAEANK